MDPVQPGASVVQTGLGIKYIGEHAYCASGEVDTPGQNTPVTLLDFTSGSGYIVAKLQFGSFSDSNNNIAFSVKFNGATVMGYVISGGQDQPRNYVPLVIPPFTAVECIGNNLESGSAIPILSFMAGRVYGAK